ncbi:MAG: hypothetical protein P1P87_00960 [Trueperaceae bacterium]|nr:hypothetical protein [Trueperaceae bacterium]
MFWLVFSVLQLAGAGYVLAAVLSWRGARFRPSREHPFAVLPTALIALAWIAAVVAMVAVGDVEFSRWAGTGGLMLATLGSLFVLLRVR